MSCMNHQIISIILKFMNLSFGTLCTEVSLQTIWSPSCPRVLNYTVKINYHWGSSQWRTSRRLKRRIRKMRFLLQHAKPNQACPFTKLLYHQSESIWQAWKKLSKRGGIRRKIRTLEIWFNTCLTGLVTLVLKATAKENLDTLNILLIFSSSSYMPCDTCVKGNSKR